MTQTHIMLEIWNTWTPQWLRSFVWSVESGKCFGPFLFQKAPSENHPIKISFHLSNHFMRLNKGNASTSVGSIIRLISLQHRGKTVAVTLIDLAQPPFKFLLRDNRQTWYKTWHLWEFVCGNFPCYLFTRFNRRSAWLQFSDWKLLLNLLISHVVCWNIS